VTRGLVLALTVVTGATGLVYEVAWQRTLATLLGSHAEATAAVLGLFLAGLSAGYALFGAASRRLVARAARRGEAPALLRVYGFVEAGIGGLALLFPWAFAAVQRASLALPVTNEGLAFALDVALSGMLVLPSTLLMGGTVPLLTQGLAKSLADATRFHAFVYAFNTAGALVGALAAGFWLLPALGLRGAILAAGLVNLAVGAAFVGFGGSGERAVAPAPAAAAPRARGIGALVAIALLCGFASMALQAVWNRMAALSLGSSPFTFTLVVALFVACIALGSLAVSLLPRVSERWLPWNLLLLLLGLAALHVTLDTAPFAAHALRLEFGHDGRSFYAFWGAVFGRLLLVAGPVVALSGATLPLLFHFAKQSHGDLGGVAGRLYAWNTLGSLVGALVGGHVLLLWLDLAAVHQGALLAVALAFALAVGRVWRRRSFAALALVASSGLVLALPGWDPRALSAGLFRVRERIPAASYTAAAVLDAHFRDRELLFYDDDPVASVAVQEIAYRGERLRAIFTNGKPDGATKGDYPTMALAGLLPAVLVPRLERAFVIGWGTGVTAGELAALSTTREVAVAEISSAVLAADPLFASANLEVGRSPKLRRIRSDAYRALLRSEGRFDAIVSEPSNPWMAGVEMLFSREFLLAARSRLAPGGVYVQWFHCYESNDATLALVLRTFRSVFPDTAVWYTLGDDLLLLGFADPQLELELEVLGERAARPDLAAGLARAGIDGPVELIAHELLPRGVLAALPLDGPLHTLMHPRLTYAAAHAFFAGGRSHLPFAGAGEAGALGARRSLARQLRAREGGALSEASYATLVDESCGARADVCTAWLADWMRTRPRSPLLAERLARWHETAVGEPVSADDTRAFAALLAGRPPPRVVEAADAERQSALVRRYLQPGIPFDGRPLLALWSRCRPPPGSDACERGLLEASAWFEAASPARAGQRSSRSTSQSTSAPPSHEPSGSAR
jgi:predicted membrane-bound spermidine synthase